MLAPRSSYDNKRKMATLSTFAAGYFNWEYIEFKYHDQMNAKGSKD